MSDSKAMENPGENNWEDRDPGPDLVRPYFVGSGYDMTIPPGDPVGDGMPGGSVPPPEAAGAGMFRRSEPATTSVRETALLLPADVPAGHGRPSGTAGRHRALIVVSRKWSVALAVYRLYIAVGAAIVIAALAGGVALLVLPNHSKAALAGKCRSSGCHQIVPRGPGTVLPATAASTASAHRVPPAALPSAGSATAVEVVTGQAAATAPAATSPAPSLTATQPVTSTPAPSATPTQATPSTTPTTPGLTPGSWISIRATTACCTSFYIRHDDGDNRVVITQITSGSSAAAKADATWIVQAGLADSSCVSFESANDPGQYLRHFDFELYLDPDDGGSQFAQDATFCPQSGNSGQGYSFQSVNYPYKYIRHYNYVVYIASDGGSNPWDNSRLWPDDTTWLVSQPWG
jgi:Alpha-L-arabinofuranosidase B (ABFB) domain